jgi:hypothetical protein
LREVVAVARGAACWDLAGLGAWGRERCSAARCRVLAVGAGRFGGARPRGRPGHVLGELFDWRGPSVPGGFLSSCARVRESKGGERVGEGETHRGGGSWELGEARGA